MSTDRYINFIRTVTVFYGNHPTDQELKDFLEYPLIRPKLEEALSRINGQFDDFRQSVKTERPFGPRKSEDVAKEKMPQDLVQASLKSAHSVDEEGSGTMKMKGDDDLGELGNTEQQSQDSQSKYDLNKRPENPDVPVSAGTVDSKDRMEGVTKPSPELQMKHTPATAIPPNPASLKKDEPVSIPPSKPEVSFSLPNARVGEFYEHKMTQHGKDHVVITDIHNLEEVGLRWDEPSQRVTGTPVRVGSHNVTVVFTRTGESRKWFDDTLEFTVISDPKDLWQDIPSSRLESFWKPDSAHAGFESGDYVLAGASQRGRSHAHVGSCRDDDFILRPKTKTGWRILAVADGAGSAKFSREGSKVAVEVSSNLLARELDKHDKTLLSTMNTWHESKADEHRKSLNRLVYSVFRSPVYEVVKEIHQLASQNKSTLKDFYTTLLISAHKEINGRHYVVGYWRGDGAMAILSEGNYLNLMGIPDGGEYAGQTRFMDAGAAPQEDIQARVRFDVLEDMSALLLLTDGVTDPLFESDRDLDDLAAWDRYWKKKVKPLIGDDPKASAKALWESLDFWSRGNHDDRTIAALYKKGGGESEKPNEKESAELKQDSEPAMEEVESDTKEAVTDESNAAAGAVVVEGDRSTNPDAQNSSSEQVGLESAGELNINEANAADLPVESAAESAPSDGAEIAASAAEKSTTDLETAVSPVEKLQAAEADSVRKEGSGDGENQES